MVARRAVARNRTRKMDWIAELSDLGLVTLAGVLGGLLGLEREIAAKPAGLRTHMFVSAGAALLVIVSETLVEDLAPAESSVIQADPTRVIHAIVVGIGFLGAGTILHRGGDRVEGLTTAASIFLTAAIGIAVATDRVALAIGTCVLALLVLTMVGRAERFIRGAK